MHTHDVNTQIHIHTHKAHNHKHITYTDISSMSVLELGELYEEMEVLCKEYSQALVSQLALRDELEYDLEVKNRLVLCQKLWC